MKIPMFVWMAALVVLLLVVVKVLRRMSGRARALNRLGRPPSFTSRALMTPNEIEFFGRLREALPEHHIFPQVAMSALLDPLAKGKTGYADFLRIAQKRNDYGVFTPEFQLVAIVELDDRSHSRVKDQQRDGFVASAGIRTVRFQSSRRPNRDQIRQAVLLPAPTAGEPLRREPS
jgi:hypothetical protein